MGGLRRSALQSPSRIQGRLRRPSLDRHPPASPCGRNTKHALAVAKCRVERKHRFDAVPPKPFDPARRRAVCADLKVLGLNHRLARNHAAAISCAPTVGTMRHVNANTSRQLPSSSISAATSAASPPASARSNAPSQPGDSLPHKYRVPRFGACRVHIIHNDFRCDATFPIIVREIAAVDYLLKWCGLMQSKSRTLRRRSQKPPTPPARVAPAVNPTPANRAVPRQRDGIGSLILTCSPADAWS